MDKKLFGRYIFIVILVDIVSYCCSMYRVHIRNSLIVIHGVPDFEFGRKKLSPQVTTDSDTVFHEESIGEGFKIVTVAVFEKIPPFRKKNWFVFDRNF